MGRSFGRAIVGVAAACCALIADGAGWADERLAWKWAAGDEQRWVCISTRSGRVDGAVKTTWTQEERVVVRQRVTAAAGDGAADLEFTIVSMRVRVENELGVKVLDTESPDPSTTVDPAGVLRKLVDKKITCHIDTAGRVTAASGGTAFLDSLIGDCAKDPMMSSIVKQFVPTFGDEALRARFDRVLGILPSAAQAAQGGEWTGTCDIELPGLGVLLLTDRRTMEAAGESPDKLRVIKATTTATLSKPKAGDTPLAAVYVITLDKAQGQSATTVDVAAGKLVGSEASMSYTVKFEPKPGNAPPKAMTQAIEQKVKVERAPN